MTSFSKLFPETVSMEKYRIKPKSGELEKADDLDSKKVNDKNEFDRDLVQKEYSKKIK